MNDLAELDQMIAHKRRELKELLYARDAVKELHGMTEGSVISVTATATVIPLKAPKRVDKKSRLGKIKQIAAAKKKPRGARKRHTDEFKIKVLEEMAAGASWDDVIVKYKIGRSTIHSWRRAMREGKLDAKPLSSGEEANDISDDRPAAQTPDELFDATPSS